MNNHSPTANIIYNLAKLGISLRDAELFDIETYIELIEIEISILNGNSTSRKATQKDIDLFLL